MTLEEFLEYTQGAVEKVGEEFESPDDDWMSVMHIQSDKELTIVGFDPAFLQSDKTKDNMVAAMRKVIKDFRGEKVSIINSAWMSIRENDSEFHPEVKPDVMPVDDPERKEVVMIVAVSPDEKAISSHAEIIRDGTNPPKLSEWKSMGAEIHGRFVEPVLDALKYVKREIKEEV